MNTFEDWRKKFVDLIKKGIIDNSRKKINRGKTVATFCMET